MTSGRAVRWGRMHRRGDRLFVVPLDHAVTDGPILAGRPVGSLVSELARNGVDAVVLHKGGVRGVDPAAFTEMSLILHLSVSTRHAPDPDEKYLVAGVEEALRLGADAVSVHVNLGSNSEHRQIADMARTAGECDRWGVPLLAMMYPRGPRITNPRDPDLIAHAATLAADIGADIVKTPYAGSPDVMADIMRGCPIPLIVAGGPRLESTAEILSFVDDVLSAGVSGLAMGRNIFQSPDPGGLARRIANQVHGVREEVLT